MYNLWRCTYHTREVDWPFGESRDKSNQRRALVPTRRRDDHRTIYYSSTRACVFGSGDGVMDDVLDISWTCRHQHPGVPNTRYIHIATYQRFTLWRKVPLGVETTVMCVCCGWLENGWWREVACWKKARRAIPLRGTWQQFVTIVPARQHLSPCTTDEREKGIVINWNHVVKLKLDGGIAIIRVEIQFKVVQWRHRCLWP